MKNILPIILLLSFCLSANAARYSKALAITFPEFILKDATPTEVIKEINKVLKIKKVESFIILRMDKDIPEPKMSFNLKNAKISVILSTLIKGLKLEYKPDSYNFQLGNDKKHNWIVTKFYNLNSRFTYKMKDLYDKEGKNVQQYFTDQGVKTKQVAMLPGVARIIIDATIREHAKIPKLLTGR